MARTALLVSVVVGPLLLLVEPVDWRAADVALGALSGLFLCAALGLLYRGYATAPMGIVAPTSSVLIGLVPVVYDLANGATPRAVVATGIVVGLGAVALTSYTPGGHGSTIEGIVFGVASGAGFGIGFTLMDRTSEASGLSPVLVQRAVGFVVLLLVWFVDRNPVVATRPPARRLAVVAGILAAVAIGALQLGYRNGAAGPVSVATSQFATMAVLLSVAFNGERLRWWQSIGVGATAVGVALMAVG